MGGIERPGRRGEIIIADALVNPFVPCFLSFCRSLGGGGRSEASAVPLRLWQRRRIFARPRRQGLHVV